MNGKMNFIIANLLFLVYLGYGAMGIASTFILRFSFFDSINVLKARKDCNIALYRQVVVDYIYLHTQLYEYQRDSYINHVRSKGLLIY